MKRAALIADDHSLYRRGLQRLLTDQLGFSDVYEAANLNDAIAILKQHPDIELSLVDLHMPQMDGARSLEQLRQEFPHLKLAVVTASEERADVLAAVALGFAGYIPKNLPNAEVIVALETICGGRIYVPDLLMKYTYPCQMASPERPRTRIGREVTLTQRQRDVLQCLQLGMTNRQVATQLNISIGTVKVHVATLMSLLGFENRIQLAMSNSMDRTFAS